MVRKSTLRFYGRFMLLYASVFATIFILLFLKDDWDILFKDVNAMGNMSIIQIVYYFTYRWVLNFPFGILNWISEKYIWTTILFLIPNSLFMAWLLARIFPGDKKAIAKAILYFVFALGFLNFLALVVGITQGDLGQRF